MAEPSGQNKSLPATGSSRQVLAVLTTPVSVINILIARDIYLYIRV